MSRSIVGRSVDRTTGRTENWTLDMSVFWSGSNRYGEQFRGRPELACLVVPAFSALFRSNARSTADTSKSHLGLFFRFLDDQEEIARVLVHPEPLLIEHLDWSHLEVLWPHFMNWLKARPTTTQYQTNWVVYSVFQHAHQQAVQRGETETETLDIYIYFQSQQKGAYGGDVISLRDGARVFRELARCWRESVRIIRAGRVAAVDGMDPCTGSSGARRWEGSLWSDIRNRLWLILNDLPFGAAARRPEKRSAIMDGMLAYPPETEIRSPLSSESGLWAHVPSVLLTWQQLSVVMAMVCMKTGISADAVAAMPVSGWYRPDPMHPRTRVIIYAPKRIPGKRLTASSSINRSTDAFQLIQTVIDLTEPLRERARALAEQTGDQRFAKLSRLIWIYPVTLNGIGGMDSPSRRKEGQAFLTHLLAKRGVARADGRALDFSFTMGRDLWAAFAYHRSGFNHLVAAKALGHSGLASLLHYLEKRQQIAEDRIRLIELQGRVLSDLAKGKYDPKSLRRAEAGELSSKGLMCLSMDSPPAGVDPGNPGNRLCRRQRCWLCTDWYATLESLPYLLRTIGDLEKVREEVAWSLWQTSDYPIILAVCEHIVGKFHSDHIAGARPTAAALPPIIPLGRFLGTSF